MKVFSYVLIWVIGVGSAVAQDACSSLSSLSNVAILRMFQTYVGLTVESSLYRRCVREQEQSLLYKEGDSNYFSSDAVSDLSYRSKSKGFKIQTEVEDKLVTEEQYQHVDANNNDKAVKLEKLQSQDYRSIGILGD